MISPEVQQKRLLDRFPFLNPAVRIALLLAIAGAGYFGPDKANAQGGGTIPTPIGVGACFDDAFDPEGVNHVFGTVSGVSASSVEEQAAYRALTDPQGVRGQAEFTNVPEHPSLQEYPRANDWAWEMMGLEPDPEDRIIPSTTNPIKIVVIDSGINLTNGDLLQLINKGIITSGPDLVGKDCLPDDKYGHGTFVTGQMIDKDGNLGAIPYYEGIDANDVPIRIYVIRVLDEYNQGNWENVIYAMLMAEHLDADLVNMSLGGNVDDPILMGQILRALEYLRINGTHVIAAAGNWPNVPNFMPGCAPGVPNTSALDANGDIFVLNNVVCNVKLKSVAGPGVKILGRDHFNQLVYMSGTSMVAPWLTTAIALEMAENNMDFPTALQAVLDRLKIPEGWNPEHGRGIFQFNLQKKPVVEVPPVEPQNVFLPLIFFQDFSSE